MKIRNRRIFPSSPISLAVAFSLALSAVSCAYAAFFPHKIAKPAPCNIFPVTDVIRPSTASSRNNPHVPIKHNNPVPPLFLKRGGTKKKKVKSNTITVNKLAYRNYEVLETLEVGIALRGTEVKSIRNGKLNIRDGFVKPNKNGRSCALMNVHIGKHSTAGEFFQHDERRPRDLLLHKTEARRLLQKTDRVPGMTIVPLKCYWNDQNKVKFEIGLCRGKNLRDKRQDIKEREGKREASRMIKNFNVR